MELIVLLLRTTGRRSCRHLLLTRLLHHLSCRGSLPILSTYIFIEVVRTNVDCGLLLLGLLLLATGVAHLASRRCSDIGRRIYVKVTIFILMALHLFDRVEPLVALNSMVVRCKCRFKATKVDVVLVELVMLDSLLILVSKRTDGALEHLRGTGDHLLGHIVVHHLLLGGSVLLRRLATVHLVILLHHHFICCYLARQLIDCCGKFQKFVSLFLINSDRQTDRLILLIQY